MKTASHLVAGRAAEQQALARLKARGLELVATNYQCKAGELDLVMQDKNSLVIVEVRYRSSRLFGNAAETIDSHKQARLIRATQSFLQANPRFRRRPVRFDVVAIHGNAENDIEWIQDAFQCE